MKPVESLYIWIKGNKVVHTATPLTWKRTSYSYKRYILEKLGKPLPCLRIQKKVLGELEDLLAEEGYVIIYETPKHVVMTKKSVWDSWKREEDGGGEEEDN